MPIMPTSAISEAQGKQSEGYPRHDEPADAVANIEVNDAVVNLNGRIEALEQLFNQAEYEEQYWSIKRDELAVSIASLRQAREVLVNARGKGIPTAMPVSDRYADRV